MKHLLIIPVILLTLTACVTTDRGPKEIGGALVGALLGTEAGKSLDKADRLYASRTTHQTLEYAPTGTTGQWRNPESANAGSVTPLATSITATGQPSASITRPSPSALKLNPPTVRPAARQTGAGASSTRRPPAPPPPRGRRHPFPPTRTPTPNTTPPSHTTGHLLVSCQFDTRARKSTPCRVSSTAFRSLKR